MNDKTKDLKREEWLNEMRVKWNEVIRPFDSTVKSFFEPVPTLEKKHVQNCRIVIGRETFLKDHLPKCGIVAEVGTQYGYFAQKIIEISEPKELHLIDITFQYFNQAPFESAISKKKVFLHESDSATQLSKFPDKYFNWIYIDADHSYKGVTRDIEQATKKIKPDGLLIFNDYIFWSHKELFPYGVIHAVNELCLRDGWEIIYFVLDPEMYNDVVLRKL